MKLFREYYEEIKGATPTGDHDSIIEFLDRRRIANKKNLNNLKFLEGEKEYLLNRIKESEELNEKHKNRFKLELKNFLDFKGVSTKEMKWDLKG
jgi:hypothetical protein